jgi:hypothetical protein
VQRIDTTGIPPTASVVAAHAADRADEVRPCLDRDEALAAAPDPARARPASSKCRGCSDDPGLRTAECGLRTDRAMTIREAREAVRARSAAGVCGDALARIAAINPQLNAFNTVVGDGAMARAEAIDREPDRWRDAPLAGVPIAVKDNLCTRGIRPPPRRACSSTTCRLRRDRGVAPRARRRGGGRQTNCDEFAMGSSNENSAFDRCAIRGRSIEFRAAPAGVRRRRSRRGSRRWRSGPTPVAPFASQRRCAAWSASSRPTGGCRATA